MIVWVAFIWNIWTYRNNIIFRNLKPNGVKVFTLVQIKSWAWITRKYTKAMFSYFDWCLNPITCLKYVLRSVFIVEGVDFG
ncbi:hypothetical protein PHAVU_003G057100 [Phaseolus vulgaris]|uniref:Reverse transcriptase zinc-binding domain-containing protein n=1 Tax=Phaseolus vulgaris TaxID=3885 RepID=V7C8W0_PHAVU|nr:hypothetical protein PHAVU_003G057100g [Phaseolus vulgaris]ESW25690.1 hypothetical protein PHAVU_003G057100g [Phaseolus vulgaris]